MNAPTTNEAEQLARLAEEGEAISAIRQTPRRKKEWAAWRQSCEDVRQICPSFDQLDLGMRLTTLAEDVDKLKGYLQSLPAAETVPVEPAVQAALDAQEESADERPVFSIFISHKSERDGELARNLREKLLILSNKEFEVFISEKIPGAADWQDWVETSVRSCDMLLFLHTTEHDDNRWLLYEAGLFRGSRSEKLHLVCLKNPNLENPPPQLARLQAYAANEEGIKDFLMALLHRGTFTDGYQVNRHLRDDDEKVFNDAIQSISEQFREQQISVDYFRNRLNIGPIQYESPDDEVLLLDEVNVDANDVTRQLLGLPEGSLQWRDIYEQCMESGVQWLQELHEALNLIRRKRAFNQVLTPFDTLNGRTCFPVISRVERLQNMPTSVTVIFVERGPSDPREDHATTLLRAPQRFLAIVTMLNMARRFRWNVLSPYIQRLSGFDSGDSDMDELGSELWTLLLRIEKEAAEEGFTDPAHVADVFPEGYRARIKEYFNDYAVARAELKHAVEARDRGQTLAALEKMLPLNKRFLLAGTQRYHSLIVGLDPVEIRDEDIGL